MAEAFCPHLGSDLGPAAGGRICDGRLVCPFHGYEFDATGQCVATPFAERRINELAVGDEGPLRVSSLSPVVVEDEYKKATEEGMAPLIGLALLLIAVLLLLFTRTLSDMLLTLAGLVLALTWIVGAEGWIQTEGDVP